MNVHPVALVSPRAQLGQNVEVGPFCVIEDDAQIGDGCRLASRVIIKAGTVLGCDNQIAEGAVLGGQPQHAKPPEQTGGLTIGSHNVIRENVTIHRGLMAGHATTIGDGNFLMVNVHVAHDCHVGNNTIFVNNVMLAGHVTVEDRAFLSGASAVHQFCRVGSLAMVGGMARITRDVPPFVTVDGACAMIVGLNLVGLKRAGFKSEEIAELKRAYRLIYRGGLLWAEAVEQLRVQFAEGPAAQFHAFFSGGKRGFTPERRVPPHSTLRMPAAADAEPELKYKAG